MLALRVDHPTNLIQEASAERRRMSPEVLKGLGNDAFKAKNYKEAVEAYDLAIEKLTGEGEEEEEVVEEEEEEEEEDGSWETVSSDEREVMEEYRLSPNPNPNPNCR